MVTISDHLTSPGEILHHIGMHISYLARKYSYTNKTFLWPFLKCRQTKNIYACTGVCTTHLMRLLRPMDIVLLDCQYFDDHLHAYLVSSDLGFFHFKSTSGAKWDTISSYTKSQPKTFIQRWSKDHCNNKYLVHLLCKNVFLSSNYIH
jgi:hypothetical protein